MVALEISTQRRASNHQPGNASVDPTFESRECPVERRNNPWTLGATRLRSALFLRNHLPPVSWAMDFFTVPTLRFQILYIVVILNHSRRQVVHFAVTPHPTT